MDWGDLRFVLAAARAGSFLGAAKMLRVTHTTVSRHIAALESDLGQPLFERTREGCAPTAFCLRILPTAERVEGEMRQLSLVSDRHVTEPEGLVQIHAANWIIARVLAPYAAEFRADFPGLRLAFVGDLVESFRKATVTTMHLRFEVMSKRSEFEQTLGQIPFAVHRPAGVADADLPWVSNHGGSITLRTLNWLSAKNVPEDALSATATDALGVCALIKAGVGQGLIPDFIGRTEDGVTRAHDGAPDIYRPIRIFFERRLIDTPELVAARNWVARSLDRSGVYDTGAGEGVLSRPEE